MNKLIITLVLATAVTTACSNSDQPTKEEIAKRIAAYNEEGARRVAARKLEAQKRKEEQRKLEEQLAVEKQLEEQRALEERRRFRKNLVTADDQALKKLLAECRNAVSEEAQSRNRGPFGTYLIDKYTADSIKYRASGRALESDELRIKNMRESAKRQSDDLPRLSMRYAVMSAHDSFSGPVRTIKEYDCKIGTDLSIADVTGGY